MTDVVRIMLMAPWVIATPDSILHICACCFILIMSWHAISNFMILQSSNILLMLIHNLHFHCKYYNISLYSIAMPFTLIQLQFTASFICSSSKALFGCFKINHCIYSSIHFGIIPMQKINNHVFPFMKGWFYIGKHIFMYKRLNLVAKHECNYSFIDCRLQWFQLHVFHFCYPKITITLLTMPPYTVLMYSKLACKRMSPFGKKHNMVMYKNHVHMLFTK